MGEDEKKRASDLFTTTIQIGSSVLANGMRIMPGSLILVIALNLHFEPEIVNALYHLGTSEKGFAGLMAMAERMLWQSVVMSFSLAILDAGARTFLKRNKTHIRL